jgi:carbazole 1,9a-dioxygenase
MSDHPHSLAHWQGYIDAKLGFRNHWYPMLLSKDLGDKPVGVTILGENLLVLRSYGQVFAVQDRCEHRGARFSARPECFAEGRITCWLHGFTYDVRDGTLVDILSAPNNFIIGRLQLKTYPVREAQGLIFVFIGDIEPVPLDDDVQPSFLDADMVVEGISQVVNSNWRVGCENGNDGTHIWIHRNSRLVKENDVAFPAGFLIKNYEDGVKVVEGPGPKGVISPHGHESHIPTFDPTLEGKRLFDLPGKYGKKRVATSVESWMPCGTKVADIPDPGLTYFEWYAPVDENRHFYVQMIGKKVASQADGDRFRDEVRTKWEPMFLRDFFADDVFARERLQEFYQYDDAWSRENRFQGDITIINWRRLCSKHNRGIQRVKKP